MVCCCLIVVILTNEISFSELLHLAQIMVDGVQDHLTREVRTQTAALMTKPCNRESLIEIGPEMAEVGMAGTTEIAETVGISVITGIEMAEITTTILTPVPPPQVRINMAK